MKKLLKDAAHGIAKLLRAILPTVLLLLGAAAVAYGIGEIYPPAGIIAAGALSMTGGVLLIKGGTDDE